MKLLFLFILFPSLISASIKVAIVGDSISNGYGVKKGECYVDLLQKKFNNENRDISILNRSFDGATTKDGQYAVIQLLTMDKPDYIVIFLGLNDTGRQIPSEKMKKHFVSMTEKSFHNCKRVIIGGVECLDDEYNKILASIYAHLIDTFNAYPIMLFGPDVKATNPGGHPSAEGHKLIAEYLYEALKDCGCK